MSETINAHQKKGKFVNVEGINIFTIDHGTGDPVVLLHGFFASSYSYRKIIPILGEKYRVIAPDLPGIGFSESPTSSYSHRYFAHLLFKFLEQMTDEKVHLVVHDYAGPISFLLLNEHPEKIKSITVISSFLNLKKFSLYFPLNLISVRFLGDFLSFFLNFFTLRFLFNFKFLSKEKPMDFITAKDYSFLLFNGKTRRNFVKMSQSFDRTIHAQRDMENGIKKMIGGRQILMGQHDKILSHMESEYMKQVMRLSLINYLPGKHFLMEDCPMECAAKIDMLVKAFSKREK
ncbi:MAG: alpha/beta fold hydrolase [Leptospira sp.]|nr:alpha/beta fold hydrolase [Leptospira sp.]